MSYTQPKYTAGIVRDGDPNGRPGYNQMLNLEPERGAGTSLVFRKPCHNYNSQVLGRTLDEVINGQLLPQVAGHFLHEMFFFESGIDKPQYNCMLVYRSVDPVKTVGLQEIYTWAIYSNAPSLSKMNDTKNAWAAPANGWQNEWVLLEDNIQAPSCYPEIIGGTVKIPLGNADWGVTGQPTNDYRLFYDLCADGNARNYYSAGGSNYRFTIDRTTQQNITTRMGQGGCVYAGWLYDYGKLYSPFTTKAAIVPIQISPTIVFGNAQKNPIDGGDWSFLIAPVYDEDPEQLGTPYYIFISQYQGNNAGTGTASIWSQNNAIINLKIKCNVTAAILTSSGYVVSPRIHSLKVFAKRTNYALGDDTDYLLMGVIDVNDVLATGSYSNWYFDMGVYNGAVMESWIGDTGGRAVKTDALTGNIGTIVNVPFFGTWYYAYQSSNDATIQADDDAITLKATGFVARSETVMAYGTSGDAGQMKIRETERPTNRGMYDVWPQDAVTWKPGAAETITFLCVHDDRVYQFHENSVYHLEVRDVLGGRTTYMYEEDSAGVGLPKEYLSSFAQGRYGVFFCNPAGVWVLRTGQRAQNIAEGHWLTDWLALTEDQRRGAVGGYDFATDQYWLVIPGTNPIEYDQYGQIHPVPIGTIIPTVYVFEDGDPREKFWHPYQFAQVNEFGGFAEDRYGNFIAYGKIGQDVAFLARYEGSATQYDFADSSQGAQYVLESNRFGDRAESTFVVAADVQRKCGAAHTMTLQLFVNGSDVIAQSLAIPGTDAMKSWLTMPPMLAREFSWCIVGTFPQVGTPPLTVADVRTEIYTVTILTKEDFKRKG